MMTTLFLSLLIIINCNIAWNFNFQKTLLGRKFSFNLFANNEWNGMISQSELMLKDQCVLVDNYDNVIGSASKFDAHQFNNINNDGLLHRAFSVFLFNNENKLLLQKRALDKITFPGVWTNTCCSHPLFGFEPSEVDNDENILSGNVKGINYAAFRKLDHELGLKSNQIINLKYLTRIHYCAKDVVIVDNNFNKKDEINNSEKIKNLQQDIEQQKNQINLKNINNR
jgi:isopentenyl-diphosphate delta-isomerase